MAFERPTLRFWRIRKDARHHDTWDPGVNTASPPLFSDGIRTPHDSILAVPQCVRHHDLAGQLDRLIVGEPGLAF